MDIIKKFEGIDLDNFMNLKASRVYDLLMEEKDLPLEESISVQKIKDALIGEEILDLNTENVLPDLNLLINNIPDNLTTLEKVRWIYINMGKLFSYDYRVVDDMKYGTLRKVDYENYIGRYQTCIQISEILNNVLNKIDGVSSKVIERKLEKERGLFGESHVANEVTINDENLVLLLDLTLDLFYIQSSSLTKHFGYETNNEGTYDIIPQVENKNMDQKMGLLPEEITDYKINNMLELFKSIPQDMPLKEKLDFKLHKINSLNKTFKGYHEGKQYVNMLFRNLLDAYYREFNIYYKKENEVNLKTVFRITIEDEERWIIYSNNTGFISTTKDKINEMLLSGWYTNSNSLFDYLNSDLEKKKTL